MGFLSDVLGTKNNFQATPTNLNDVYNGAQVTDANSRTLGGLSQQQNFADAVAARNGLGNQANVFAQQQALANTLGQQAQGVGPNPALAQLHQQTAQNINNQAALMGSQRGAGANIGLLARQAAQQGAGIQQQAVGQEATLQAQQQLAAQNALMQQQNALQGVASQQIGNQANAIQNLNAVAQGRAGQIGQGYSNQQQQHIQNNLGADQINAGVAQGNASTNAGIVGGLLGAGGAALGLAHGGQVSAYADGGQVNQWHSGTPEQQHSNAQSAQSGFLAAANNNPVSKAIGWLTGAPQGKACGGVIMQEGGHVPGRAEVKGDSYTNDTVPAMLSPGEVVIPRHIMQGKDPAKMAAEFVAQVLAKKKVDPKNKFADGGDVQDDSLELPTQSIITPDVTSMMSEPAQSVEPTQMSGESAGGLGAQQTIAMPSQAPDSTASSSSKIQSALGQVGAGLKAQAAAQGALGKEQSNLIGQDIAQKQAIQAKYVEDQKPLMQRRQELTKAYEDDKIDHNRLWNNKSTPQQISTAIGLMLGGIGAGLTHGENPAMKYLNMQIENDVKSQEAELGKKHNLLAQNLQDMGNLRDARLETLGNQRDIAALNMQQAIAKASDPIAKARLQQQLGQFNIQTEQMLAPLKLKEATVKAMQSGQMDPVQAVPIMVPKEQQPKAFEEAGRLQNISKNSDLILKKFDQAASEYKINPFGERSGVKAFHQLLLPNFKSVDGTVRQAAMDETFKNLTPAINDTPAQLKTKRDGVLQWMHSEMAAPTLKAYGIDPQKFQSTTSDPYMKLTPQQQGFAQHARAIGDHVMLKKLGLE